MVRHNDAPRSIGDCLRVLDIDEILAECGSLQDEFRYVKRCYHHKILQVHPDKGGDAETFRKTQAAFDVLRAKVQSGRIDGLSQFLDTCATEPTTTTTVDDDDTTPTDYERYYREDSDIPSYDFFCAAAEEEVPPIKVEPARSGRSKCVECAPKKKKKKKKTAVDAAAPVTTTTLAKSPCIPKGELRVGSMDKDSGTYCRWNHLKCWRIPYYVWGYFTDPTDPDCVLQGLLQLDDVIFSNLRSLTDQDLDALVAQVMDQSKWKSKRLARKRPPPKPVHAPVPNTLATLHDNVLTGEALVAQSGKQRFRIPVPGVNGAIADCFQGKKFVLTGTFPEVGGGIGLNQGKERLKAMLESFGARVTSSVSGKTDYLVVGKNPGFTKLNGAEQRKVLKVDVKGLEKVIFGSFPQLEAAPVIPEIESFSKGYPGAKRLNY